MHACSKISHAYFCKILELNPATLVTALVGTTYAGSSKSQGGVLAVNGNIYFASSSNAQIIELIPSTGVTRLVGNSYSSVTKSYGGVLAPNNKIYFTPSTAPRVLELSKVDTPNVLGTDAVIPSPLSGLAASNYNKYYNKF